MALRKILMLHGYSQNATIFSKRLGAIRKACGNDIELVFVDAPHILLPADLVGFTSAALGAAEAANANEDPALTPRAWWKANPERTQAIGLLESLATLKDILSKDKYDGVFGFSQGAAMATLLSALLEKPETYPPFSVDGKSPHPPFKFCVSVSGFKAQGPEAAAIFGDSYNTPTLFITGKTDVVVVEERSLIIEKIARNQRAERHDGGHLVPSKANWRTFFKDFLTADDPFMVSSPSGKANSTSTSEASTPLSPSPIPGVTARSIL